MNDHFAVRVQLLMDDDLNGPDQQQQRIVRGTMTRQREKNSFKT